MKIIFERHPRWCTWDGFHAGEAAQYVTPKYQYQPTGRVVPFAGSRWAVRRVVAHQGGHALAIVARLTDDAARGLELPACAFIADEKEYQSELKGQA